MSDWLKQTDEPLFPDIFWEVPLNRAQAKKLLIVGGHAKQFAETVGLYQYALAAGIGSARVVLPDSLRKLIGSQPDCLFVESNPSGSISKNACTEILAYASECDGIIFSSELSHNTETISLLETLFTEITYPIFFSSNVLEMLSFQPELMLGNERVLVTDTKRLTRFADKIHLPITIKLQDSILNKIDFMTNITNTYPLALILDESPLIIATEGQVSSTELNQNTASSGELIAKMAVFYLQHTNHFKALTSAAYALATAKLK